MNRWVLYELPLPPPPPLPPSHTHNQYTEALVPCRVVMCLINWLAGWLVGWLARPKVYVAKESTGRDTCCENGHSSDDME